MKGAAQRASESVRMEEYRRIYIRCLRAQRADRIVAKVLLVIFAVAVLKTAPDVSVSGYPSICESRIWVLTARR